MVLSLVLPDEQTWAMSGLALEGAEPAFELGRVRQVLLPDRVPDVLAGPLAETLASLPPDVETVDRRVRYPGTAIGELRAVPEPPHDHGGHDHGDMMAIVGEPSADGLVMEPIELRFGPLGTPLPAGIVAGVTLDGDVVAAAGVEALFGPDVRRDVPDPLAPKAWELARAPGEDRWTELAAVEVERAVSHTAWLRAFARVLGWSELIDRTGGALAALAVLPPALELARPRLEALADLAESSRRLRWRTAGRGRVSPERARALGLHGPSARASGLPVDARTEDPRYRRLGFQPIVRTEGDALARTRVRAAEAVAAVELAVAALAIADPPPTAAGPVEGPRGPLSAAGGRLEAPGESAALVAAGEAMTGLEWASALTVLASFDLSPWRVTA